MLISVLIHEQATVLLELLPLIVFVVVDIVVVANYKTVACALNISSSFGLPLGICANIVGLVLST
jgi:hypothetical protein